MRKFFATVLLAVTMLGLPSFANAQAGFIFGMILGSSMSSGTSVQGDANANVLYLMPRVAERVKDPLEMRIWQVRYDGGTIRKKFSEILPSNAKPDDYELLQVVRVADQGNADRMYLWFTYIEKRFLIPLDKLPPSTQNNN